MLLVQFSTILLKCELSLSRGGTLRSTLACTLTMWIFFPCVFVSCCIQNLLWCCFCYESSVCSYRESTLQAETSWVLAVWTWKKDLICRSALTQCLHVWEAQSLSLIQRGCCGNMQFETGQSVAADQVIKILLCSRKDQSSSSTPPISSVSPNV